MFLTADSGGCLIKICEKCTIPLWWADTLKRRIEDPMLLRSLVKSLPRKKESNKRILPHDIKKHPVLLVD